MVFNGEYTETDQFGSHEVNKVYVYDRNADRVTVLSDPVTHTPTVSEGDMPQTNGNGLLITFVRNDNTGVQHVSIYKSDGTLLKDITAANSAVPDNLNNFQNVSISNDGGYVTFWAYAQDASFNPSGLASLFLLDRQANSIVAVGTTTAGHDLWAGSLSRDGRFIVFQSDQKSRFKRPGYQWRHH